MATPSYRLTEFKVQGSGRFPIDMLRHDSAVPATSADVDHILHEDGARVVCLRRFYPVGGIAEPVAMRWRSFGWQVTEVNGKAVL